PSAAEVLAICISENRLSCMRAPPLALKQTSGAPSSIARSAARAKRSPTTEPIEPPMKAKSKAQATIGRVARVPSRATSASRSPLDFCAALIRSAYFFWSLNLSTSVGPSAAPISVPVPGSRNAASRARARIGMWWLHFGQTSRFSSSSGRYSTEPHLSHFSHSPSGTLRLRLVAASVRIPPGISFLSQLIQAVLEGPGKAAIFAQGGAGAVDRRAQRGQEGTRAGRRIGGIPRVRHRLHQRAADHHAVGMRGHVRRGG